MKTILKLNEEVNGLKLIQVNEGFVVVDIESIAVNEDYCYDTLRNHIWRKSQKFTCNGSIYKKIIFAKPNLNLEGVPEIEEFLPKGTGAIFLAKELLKKEGYQENSDTLNYLNIAIESIEQAQQNSFSEEQIREAINFAWYNGAKESYEGKTMIFDIDQDKIIQSLKQPKVEITFENGVPVKAVML